MRLGWGWEKSAKFEGTTYGLYRGNNGQENGNNRDYLGV